MDKLKMHSPDTTQQNIVKFLELFPNCKTEKQDGSGELSTGIDFDLLKQELSKYIVEGPKERYQLNWPGKKEALLTANAPIAKTLRPCREESVDFDSTENLFIEGDNLDALKLLQETYLGKVKMIYIDPPYNTGKDFIYADNFAESTDEYLQESGQKDEDGNRLVANTDSNGRFHSDWLSMIYSRLRLARNLLKEDGVIFMSINDDEVHNLRKIGDEIFGEDNFVSCLVWNTEGHTDNQYDIKVNHEYVIVYAKDSSSLELGYVVDPNTRKKSNLWKGYAENSITKNGAANPPSEVTLPVGFPCLAELVTIPSNDKSNEFYNAVEAAGFISRKITQEYDVSYPIKKNSMEIFNFKLSKECKVFSGWANVNKLKKFIDNGCLPIKEGDGDFTEFYLSAKGVIYYKKTRSKARNIVSVLKSMGTTEQMRSELERMGLIFSYPKPVQLLKYLMQIGLAGKDDVFMDFFAGSSSSVHALMSLNAEASSNHKYIAVQLPEACSERSEGFEAGYKTIAEISKERIRRAGTKIKEESPKATDLDTGFRVLKIDSSNMNEVHYMPDLVSKGDLFNQVENIKTDRSSEDLLFQVMLDWGVDLSLSIRKETIEGKEVYFVNDDDHAPCDLVACFDKGIDEALIKFLAGKQPLRVVFRDDGFVSDSVKINVEQIFKQLAPATDIKAI